MEIVISIWPDEATAMRKDGDAFTESYIPPLGSPVPRVGELVTVPHPEHVLVHGVVLWVHYIYNLKQITVTCVKQD